MRRAYKFRLYPNVHQLRELGIMLETHRRLYNACLAQRKDVWEEGKRSVKYTEQSSWYKTERDANPYFARLNFSSAQATMRRLDKAFTAFFRRVKAGEKPGYPRFKGIGRFRSIEFPAYRDGIKLVNGKLRVQYVGAMRIKMHREIEGTIKTVSIKEEGGKWYAVFSCDLGDVEVAPNEEPPVGIDVGLEAFLTTSAGERFDNPRNLKVSLPALRRKSRAVSRKQRRGKNRRKAVVQLQRIHARVREQRRDHHHKVALTLVRSYGLIAVENLNIRGMVRNHRLARSISDAAWGSFVSVLVSKAESAGAEVVKVNPAGTSQECSQCDATVKKALSVRTHNCPSCGLRLHRDENAARNILARGLLARTEPVERNVGGRVMRAPRSCLL